eukprot:scaffold2697_cov346-Pavlova_lutheri.AAC.25
MGCRQGRTWFGVYPLNDAMQTPVWFQPPPLGGVVGSVGGPTTSISWCCRAWGTRTVPFDPRQSVPDVRLTLLAVLRLCPPTCTAPTLGWCGHRGSPPLHAIHTWSEGWNEPGVCLIHKKSHNRPQRGRGDVSSTDDDVSPTLRVGSTPTLEAKKVASLLATGRNLSDTLRGIWKPLWSSKAYALLLAVMRSSRIALACCYIPLRSMEILISGITYLPVHVLHY